MCADITGNAGETLRVDYSVENTGGSTDSQDIELQNDTDEVLIDSDTGVELASSEVGSGILSWDTTENDEGTYDLFVQSDDSSELLTVKLTDPDIPLSEADQKLTHRWVLDDVASGTVEDSEGVADGTVNGVTSVSGDWAGNSSGEGDGTDDNIETTTWGSFGSSMDSDFAIAFSISGLTTTNTVAALAVGNSGDDTFLSIQFNNDDSDVVEFALRGTQNNNNNSTQSFASTAITDGGTYRVVCNKTGNTGDDLDVWVNQTDDSATASSNSSSLNSPTDFDTNTSLFAYNASGSIIRPIPAIIDDVCVFNNSLTQSEIQSYNNPWE